MIDIFKQLITPLILFSLGYVFKYVAEIIKQFRLLINQHQSKSNFKFQQRQTCHKRHHYAQCHQNQKD